MPDHGRADPAAIADFLRLIHPNGECFEVRAPNSIDRQGSEFRATAAGYYNDIDQAAAHIAELDDLGFAPAIYVTLNPVDPSLLARHNNRMVFKVRNLTKESNIQRRSALLLDFDPDRPSGISATNDEWIASLELAAEVQRDLSALGWPAAIFGTSGNGGHLIYAVDLDRGSDLIKRVLSGLDSKYSTATVKLDTGVYDACRITKVLGTVARKGDELLDVAETDKRPHRRSEVFSSPSQLSPVSDALLEAVAASSGSKAQPPTTSLSPSGSAPTPNVERWLEMLESHGAGVKGTSRRGDKTLIFLERCIVDPTITSTSASDIAIFVGDDGSLGYSNFHDRGRHYKISDVLQKLDPGGLDIGAEAKEKRDKNASQADKLVALGRAADLFRSSASADPEAFGAIAFDDRQETWSIRSTRFKRWLSQRYFETHAKSPNKEAIASAINTLEAVALFGDSSRDTAIRVHETGDTIYVDLCDEQWSAVRITGDGWEVVNHRDLESHFVRRRGMEPLPCPEPGGSVDDLREFVNVPEDATWMLVVAFVVMSFCGRGPYPVLAITGEQGSAKSTLCRIIRAIVDPNLCELRAPPKDERDLVIAARNSRLLAFDNLSGLKNDLADAICRMSTGSGFGTRQLYTDDEEVLFSVHRPVMINGIDDLATRADLADRSLFIHLLGIEDDQRVAERSLWEGFLAQRPLILGAIFDAVSTALRNRAGVELPELPRMADFAIFIVAACESLGWHPADFMTAYHENRQESFRNAIESTAIGPLILKFIDDTESWAGTAQDLLEAISTPSYVIMRPRGERGWPRSPRGMSGALRRIAPALTSLGYTVRFSKEGSGASTRRLIELKRAERANAAETVETVETVVQRLSEGGSSGR